ncbi:MAG: peptidylprolyl isomerase [Gemmatimonadaceae bacterium]|jgi:peptidyl-prolyl cis-trans isomerase SurA|nr:peptidylprolyl isomerase [Gemmatimonadaceae bacterium]
MPVLRRLPALAALLALPVVVGAQPRPARAPIASLDVDRVIAVAGDKPILWSEVLEELNTRRAQGMPIPPDSVEQRQLVERIIGELVDAELLVQKAGVEKVTVTDADLASGVETQYKRVRDQFPSENEFRAALRGAGFGTPDEYRRMLTDQSRKQELQRKLVSKMQADGKMVRATVSEADVAEAFARNRGQLPRRPAQVTFRQLVLTPQPSAANKALGRARIDSVVAQLRAGADFATLARKYSDDPGSKELGGDLGWNRRGRMVPEFDRMMFALPPGQVSPVIETIFGFHVIKVDKVQPAEVKARHILVRYTVDSADVARTRRLADSVATAWRTGARIDSLYAKFHDPDEVKVFADPINRADLPAQYDSAFTRTPVGTVGAPFEILDRQKGVPKFFIVQPSSVVDEGEYAIADLRERIRGQLIEERSMRRFIDGLRKASFVRIAPIPALPPLAPGPEGAGAPRDR